MPSVKLTLGKELFNLLINVLDFNMKLEVEGDFSMVAEKLKNKLLKYSVPRKNEENIDFVDVRFFPNEAGNMIEQLLLRIDKKEMKEDFFSLLIKNREIK